MKVGRDQSTDYVSENGESRHEVSFWTYAKDDQNAIERILRTLQFVLTDKDDPINIMVASCIHDWELMPGIKSEIDCGHVGPQNDNVPDDPFAKEKTE